VLLPPPIKPIMPPAPFVFRR